MNTDLEFERARLRLHQSIDSAAEAAHEAIHQHTALEMDRLKVRVGWMNRSAAQSRRWHNAKGEGK